MRKQLIETALEYSTGIKRMYNQWTQTTKKPVNFKYILNKAQEWDNNKNKYPSITTEKENGDLILNVITYWNKHPILYRFVGLQDREYFYVTYSNVMT